jgi:hypothetical protein
MRTRMTPVVAVALLAAAATVVAAPDFTSMQVQRLDPKPAPAFELPDLAGNVHRLSDLRGKVVMLFFWTTW